MIRNSVAIYTLSITVSRIKVNYMLKCTISDLDAQMKLMNNSIFFFRILRFSGASSINQSFS